MLIIFLLIWVYNLLIINYIFIQILSFMLMGNLIHEIILLLQLELLHIQSLILLNAI